MRVLKYIAGSKYTSLVYKGLDSMEIVGYCDSDFASDKETGKSVFGYAFFLGGNLLSWKSKKSQSTTATSTTVAELEGIYQAATEGIWIREMLLNLKIGSNAPFKLYSDNTAAISVVTGEKYLEKTKHLVVKVEFLRDQIRDGILEVEWISTHDMTADIFTKNLGRTTFEKHLGTMGLDKQENKE